MQFSLFVFLAIGLGLSGFGCSADLDTAASCPLNFDSLGKLINGTSPSLKFDDMPTECVYMLTGLRLVRAEYLRSTGYFFPPENTSAACWDKYQVMITVTLPDFDVRSSCGFETSLISTTCRNIATRSDFEHLVSNSELNDVKQYCNQSLGDGSPCKSCTDILETIESSYFQSPHNGNASDCGGYAYVYAAAAANRFGPTDLGTAKCLFSLDLSRVTKKGKKYGVVFWGIVTGCTNGFFGTVIVLWLIWAWHLKNGKRKKDNLVQMESGRISEMEMIKGRGSPIRFTIEEIRKATNNFSRDNIIGKGGYGNVYKGALLDGSEVAVKRFKNCSAAGDPVFAHEVEVIASVRHVNLVALRGYCTATLPLEGHQRIIVCDLMHNGSLFDHLFGTSGDGPPLSWSTRQRIALGTARGLAYLHYGAQHTIIHRDVKASNILLDEDFEPRLADFGLAKFTPEGLSHVSTRVAGTLGYVAPEYALYGQLTERSDVYSFGIVLLEILSGKKAVISIQDGETVLLGDWAWSLVRDNKVLDVIDRGIPDLGAAELMEKYVLIAVLCSHPLLYARPTMDYVVKLLETDSPVPSIPDRPPPILAAGIETSSSSFSGSYPGLHPGGWEQLVYRSDHPILDKENSGESIQ